MIIGQIKNYLINNIGEKVIIIYYGSRNKKEKYSGHLLKTYDHVFLLKLEDNTIKCFNYVDIITKVIRIYVENGKNA